MVGESAVRAAVAWLIPSAKRRWGSREQQVVQTEPALCARWLAFQQHDAPSRRSSVWLYDTETQSMEAVGRSSASSFFSPQMGATAALHGPKPLEDSECRLVWLETAEELEVDEMGRTKLLTSTGGASDCTIRYLGTWVHVKCC